jgi:hypothetical protein
MPAGRPSRSGQQQMSELTALAEWFHSALCAAGYRTPHAFLSARRPPRQAPPPDKNAVYDIFGAKCLRDLDTTQRLALALGKPPESVTAEWHRAKRRLEQKELARRRRTPTPAACWDSVPLPDTWLEELLRSQAGAAEHFPYDLLGVRKPPLSEIYIEQDIQPLSTSSGRHSLISDGATPTLAAALSTHDHLFITGGPGAGKTTLGQHLVRQIARFWLREDGAETPWCAEAVAAVRITSADLLTPQAWYQQLSDAAARTGTLLAPVSPDHFAQRPHGVRWLIVVDGLDEVASPAVRQAILEKLSKQVRPNSTFRLLITSRPLPQGELEPFKDLPGIGFYTLRGFDEDQQLAFAHRWFAAQGEAEPALRAEEFFSEIDHANLHEVLRVPLLTTITAAFRTRNPHAPLPTGLATLYESFLADLRTAREGNTEVIDRFRARWEMRGLGRLVQWLLEHQDHMITHLAWEQVTSKATTSLLDEATQWLASNLPADLDWPTGADGELGQFLSQTGVLSFDGVDLAFLHHSFAEFIAAQDDSARIPADFPNLTTWSDAVSDAAARNRILFTFALWARRPGNEVGLIVRHLLARGVHHRIMALRLVTAGVPLGEALEGAVIARLLDFADDSDRRPFASPESEVFTELYPLRGNRHLSAHLRAIAETKELKSFIRVGAAVAYATAASLYEGVELLKRISETGDAFTVLDCCRQLASLAPAEQTFRVQLLRSVVADKNNSWWERLEGADQLLAAGYSEGLAELFRTLLASTEQNDRYLERAGELWFELEGEKAAGEVVRAVTARAETQSIAIRGLALTLLRFGLVDEAVPLITRVLKESFNSDDISDLTIAWLDASGSAAADQIIEIMRASPPWRHDERPSVAHDLLRNGFRSQAVALTRRCLADQPRMRHGAHLEIMVLIRAFGSSAAGEVFEWLEKLQVPPDEYASSMAELIEAGAEPDDVIFFSRYVLHHPGSKDSAFAAAARVLFRAEGHMACDEVMAALHARPYGGAALRSQLLPVLAEEGEVSAVAALEHAVLADPGVTMPELKALVLAWLTVSGRSAVEGLLPRVEAAIRLTVDQVAALAALLAQHGLVAPATGLWCRVCTTPGAAMETRWRALQRLLEAGAEVRANQALREALVAQSNPAEALALRRLMAWANPSE